MTALYILTSKRPGGASYLPKTAESLVGAGLPQWSGPKVVSSEGPAELGGFEIIARPPHPYPEAWRLMFQTALERGWDRVLMLEDDVLLCRNALLAVERVQVPPEMSFLSFYSQEKPTTDGIERRTWCNQWFYNAQMVLWPAETMRFLVERWHLIPERGRTQMPNVGKLLSGAWPFYGLVFPNLCTHIGAVSCLPGSWQRPSPSWPGQDFDALLCQFVRSV